MTGCGRAPKTSEPVEDVVALEQETAALKSRLSAALSRIDALRGELGQGDAPVALGGLAAPDIIDELAATKLTSGNRRPIQRRMDYLFENLAEQGEQAVPYIRAYLNRMEDVDFGIPKSPKDEAKELEYWRSRMVMVPLDFEHPPSLRAGLIDILAEIGGVSAAEAIAEVLTTSGRGFEIAYAARALRSMIGPDAYRDEALGAAHELLTEPIAVAGGNKFDAASRQYLFRVLEMYNDQSFVEIAQGQLVNEEGRIDRSVLSYFREIGDGRAIHAVVQAMQSGQLRESDMREMARVAVRGVGQNDAQADSLFQDIMTSDQYSLDVKMETIRSMDNSEDLTNMNKEEQATVLQSRLALMDTIQLGDDDIMSWANEIYSGRVESKIEGRGFDDERAYETMHANFRKLTDQVNREQRSGERQQVIPAGPTVVPSP
ncbi:MAG: hypothetical protein QF721_08660 [Verrucomicrobiota bacterium]|nr:hypothetical protein [Verrucomicrobiota bacterium]MDP7049509.1 hypothetical protein [Verrucomicrobiota bacterium]